MSQAILQQLCDLRGIQSEFVDAWGKPARVADESKIKMLAAMGYDPVSQEALSARTGWGPAELGARLLELELMGQVDRLPGQLFQRVAAA